MQIQFAQNKMLKYLICEIQKKKTKQKNRTKQKTKKTPQRF